MLKSLLIIVAGICLGGAAAVPIQAATLFARSFPHTGEVRLENRSIVPVPLVFYSIKSTAGALNGSPVRWLSITDHYDAPFGTTPGNGFIDPNNQWMKIAATSTELTEGAFSGPGGSLAPQRAISLGRIWNPAIPFENLQFSATEPNGQPISIFSIAGLDGDYDENSVVNSFDYARWRSALGKTSVVEDGNLNGIVDTADYVVWRNNMGLSLSGSGSTLAGGASLPALGLGAVVPEPSARLIGAALGVLCACRRLARRV